MTEIRVQKNEQADMYMVQIQCKSSHWHTILWIPGELIYRSTYTCSHYKSQTDQVESGEITP